MRYKATGDIDYDDLSLKAGDPIPDDWPEERVLALVDVGAVAPAARTKAETPSAEEKDRA